MVNYGIRIKHRDRNILIWAECIICSGANVLEPISHPVRIKILTSFSFFLANLELWLGICFLFNSIKQTAFILKLKGLKSEKGFETMVEIPKTEKYERKITPIERLFFRNEF